MPIRHTDEVLDPVRPPLLASPADGEAVRELLRLAATGAGAPWATFSLDREVTSWPSEAERTGEPGCEVAVTSPFGTAGCLEVGPSSAADGGVEIATQVAGVIERWLDRAVEANASEGLARRLYLSEERLAESLDELEASNRQLENFAYVASHELLHPLRAVAAFVDLLPDLVTSGNDAGLESAVTHIRNGTSAMQLQVTALLELAAPTASLDSADLVDPADAAHLAIDSLATVLSENGAIVEVEDLPVVRARPVPLQSIFHNLIINAVRYAEPSRPLRLRIYGTRGPRESTVVVEDNGIGIDHNDQRRIFGIFERAAADRSGSGIGLALAVRIMQSVGGSISLESEPGKGSAFTLHFPDDCGQNGSTHKR